MLKGRHARRGLRADGSGLLPMFPIGEINSLRRGCHGSLARNMIGIFTDAFSAES